jgi:hypothetical protein
VRDMLLVARVQFLFARRHLRGISVSMAIRSPTVFYKSFPEGFFDDPNLLTMFNPSA